MNEIVLIVEDEPIFAEFLTRTLKQFGYLPEIPVSSGEEALEILQTTKIDVVLMDIELEGEMNGIQCAEIITEQIGLPCIYITAFKDSETLEKAIKTEPYGYIVKPMVDEERLDITIKIALSNHKKKQNLQKQAQKLDTIAKYISEDAEKPVKAFKNAPQSISISQSNNPVINDTTFDQEEFFGILNAIGSSDRFHILTLLKDETRNMTEINDKISKSTSTLSHHLHSLMEIGILIGWRHGKFTNYSFNKHTIENFTKNWMEWMNILNFDLDNDHPTGEGTTTDYSVLQNFFDKIDHEDRLDIIKILANTPLTLVDLKNELEKPQSSIYYHVKKLEEGNVLTNITKGKFTEYHLNKKTIYQAFQIWEEWAAEISNFMENIE